MRSRSGLVLITAAALLAGSAAHAGTLLAATWTTTLQGVDLTITNNTATCTNVDPNHVQQTITCPGVGLGATGTATPTSYSVSLTVGLFAINQFTTGGPVNFHTKAVLGADTIGIAGTNSSASATMFVNGAVTLKVAHHVGKGANASMLTPSPTTLVKVPLSVGKAATGLSLYFNNLHYMTVDFHAWTAHTLTFSGLTSLNKALPDVTAKGSFMLTPGGGGTVTLVSPSKISIDGLLLQRQTVSLTTLKLSYAPEPGTLLLLGAAVAGFVLVGRRTRG